MYRNNDRTNKNIKLISGSDSPSFQASSENEIGTARANAPIAI